MEEICERNNLKAALQRVRRNKGSPGVDGLTVDELPDYLKTHWLAIKASLQEGRYQPQAVRRVEIPKPGSTEKRKLGIPCVLDRRLMSRLATKIADKRVLKLIRGYLRAGILEHGLVSVPTEGTPQAGPLSPFLSNVVLDELDKELESRGHRYVRYADDCNIYVCSRRAGERVMESINRFITQRLKLKVNAGKSAVDIPQNRTFLGYTFTGGKSPNRRKIAAKSIKRFKAEVRHLTRRNWSISLEDRINRLSRYLSRLLIFSLRKAV